jgi:cyclomaltodextrinase / maltogenic alpha-amylase / neopullulanase
VSAEQPESSGWDNLTVKPNNNGPVNSTPDTTDAARYQRREADWRNGAIVYQVLVDRFAPAAAPAAKRHLYPPPRTLHPWSEAPRKGVRLRREGLWSHELAFWGGDLRSVRSKLDHVQSLGADVLLLNPVHLALTNHKYDPLDYFQVSPEYGTREDLRELAADLHRRGMRLVLDGVFNHMGRRSSWFQEALSDPGSGRRDWFFIGSEYRLGYRAWANVPNLPELRLENPAVRARIFEDEDSAVRTSLRDGIDGWRLDTAYDLGIEILEGLTRAAHETKAGSMVVGEVWNYPAGWMPPLDGVLNFHAREILLRMAAGQLAGSQAGRMLSRMVDDAGIEPMLKSWLVLDNHDMPRLRNLIPDGKLRRMAQALHFTLPGSPCLYYGAEVGMKGGEDPEMRAPMRWDRVLENNPHLAWMRKLIALRQASRALRVGDFCVLDTRELLAFSRQTDRVAEIVIVVANPTRTSVREAFSCRDGKLMSGTHLVDALDGTQVTVYSGLIDLEVPPRTARVLRLPPDPGVEYSPYKRTP